MDEKNNGGSAFPDFKQTGMTLRDYFAAKAMQALVSKPIGTPKDALAIPKTAYALADAMLVERAQ